MSGHWCGPGGHVINKTVFSEWPCFKIRLESVRPTGGTRKMRGACGKPNKQRLLWTVANGGRYCIMSTKIGNE